MKALHHLEEWPTELAAGGWIHANGGGHRAGDTGHPFPLASVTKPLFAYAVLVAIEEGTLHLDQPAGPQGATVRHLLAHASGLGDNPTQQLARVEKRRIYSNGGFELLGHLLTQSAGMPAAQYLHEAVVGPLGLTTVALEGSPAHGAVGSVDDLLTLAAEWLAPTLVSASTMQGATRVHFPHLSGVLPGFGRQDPNPWGLGFELRGSKTTHWTGAANSTATFGHFGRSGTFVWVDPEAAVACVVLTNRDFGPWAIEAWPQLADAVLAEAGGSTGATGPSW
ncbi:MAG: beta-lactamase family protein [Actinomycetia bacterium]|nr:beta-lactamase family protein [Actinomycetes bacterium]MCP5032759.1 beta-lactamase family protein [Actinomycetes bacterium]